MSNSSTKELSSGSVSELTQLRNKSFHGLVANLSLHNGNLSSIGPGMSSTSLSDMEGYANAEEDSFTRMGYGESASDYLGPYTATSIILPQLPAPPPVSSLVPVFTPDTLGDAYGGGYWGVPLEYDASGPSNPAIPIGYTNNVGSSASLGRYASSPTTVAARVDLPDYLASVYHDFPIGTASTSDGDMISYATNAPTADGDRPFKIYLDHIQNMLYSSQERPSDSILATGLSASNSSGALSVPSETLVSTSAFQSGGASSIPNGGLMMPVYVSQSDSLRPFHVVTALGVGIFVGLIVL